VCSVIHPVARFDPPEQIRRFNRVQMLEATAASVLAAAIIGTAGGMGWLLITLPTRLNQLEGQVTRILINQDQFESLFNGLEKTVQEHDRRIIKLEIRR